MSDVVRIREKINVYWLVVGKAGEMKPLCRPRYVWEYNIKIYLKKWDIRECPEFVYLKTGKRGGLLRIMNEISGSIKCVSFLTC